MKLKRFAALFLLVLLTGALLTMGAAAGNDRSLPRLVDNADLLTPSEEEYLNGMIEEVLNKYNYDVVIVTCDSLEGKTATEYADDFYDYNGYGLGPNNSGVLFLVSMRDRDWTISTAGAGIHAFTDYGQEQMMNKVRPYLSNGDYRGGLDLFIQYADYYYAMYNNGTPVDIGPTGLTAGKVGIGGVIGFLIAFISGGSMKSKMSSARTQTGAGNYILQNSFNLTGTSDVFTHATVTRVPIAQMRQSSGGGHGGGGGSSIHVSSSGVSHGGSHGKF